MILHLFFNVKYEVAPMKKIGFTKFEMIFLICSLSLIISIGIIINESWFVTICGILGLLTIFLQAKGTLSGQIIGLADNICYSILAFHYKYYGEVIVYTFILIPIFIYGIFEWFLHSNKHKVLVNNLSKKEWFISICISILISPLFYLLLYYLNSELILLNTISMITLTYANYLLARRSGVGFIFYLLNDIILICLWSIPIFNGDFTVIPLFICVFINLISDIYGIVHWKKMKKAQIK